MGISKIRAALLAAALALAAVGCTPVAAEPEQGDGPAVLAEEDGTETDTTEAGTEEAPVEEEPTEDAPAGPASFTDKYVYSDGLEVEVTKITQKKLGEWDMADGMEAGDAYYLFDVRVKNGSSEQVDVVGMAGVSYGADGHQAPQVYTDADIVLDGAILPGKAKTGAFGFGVPPESAEDVVLEFTPDFLHDAAIFSGSIE